MPLTNIPAGPISICRLVYQDSLQELMLHDPLEGVLMIRFSLNAVEVVFNSMAGLNYVAINQVDPKTRSVVVNFAAPRLLQFSPLGSAIRSSYVEPATGTELMRVAGNVPKGFSLIGQPDWNAGLRERAKGTVTTTAANVFTGTVDVALSPLKPGACIVNFNLRPVGAVNLNQGFYNVTAELLDISPALTSPAKTRKYVHNGTPNEADVSVSGVLQFDAVTADIQAVTLRVTVAGTIAKSGATPYVPYQIDFRLLN
jgi:hypothetical protein